MHNGIKIFHIVAKNVYDYVGKNNTSLWHDSTDLKRFKALTEGGILVMCRKTYESLPVKPLRNRSAYVLSSTLVATEPTTEPTDGNSTTTKVFSNLDELLDAATKEASEKGLKNIWVIGGSELYSMTEEKTDEILLSQATNNSIVAGDNDKNVYTYSVDLTNFKVTNLEFVDNVLFYTLKRNTDNRTNNNTGEKNDTINTISVALYKRLKKQQIYFVVLSFILFAFGFLNIISNILEWNNKINDVLDYVRFALLFVLVWLNSKVLNKIL